MLRRPHGQASLRVRRRSASAPKSAAPAPNRPAGECVPLVRQPQPDTVVSAPGTTSLPVMPPAPPVPVVSAPDVPTPPVATVEFAPPGPAAAVEFAPPAPVP